MQYKWRVLGECMGGGNRRRYLFAVAAVGVATFFSYVVPFLIRIVIDRVIGDSRGGEDAFSLLVSAVVPGGNPGEVPLPVWSALIVFFTLVTGLFSYWSGRAAAVASEDTAREMRERLYDHLQNVRYHYHVTARTGDLVQRCTSDVETIRKFLAVQLVEVGRAVFMTGIALPLMWSLSGRLTLVATATIPIMLLTSILFFRRVQHAFLSADEAEGALSTVLQENLAGVRVVRAFGRERYECERFELRNNAHRILTARLVRLLAGFWSLTDLLTMAQIGAVLIGATLFSFSGEVSVGTLVVFMTLEAMLLWPIRQFGRVLADMGKASVSLGRVAEIFAEPREDSDGPGEKPELSGGIAVRDLSFSYDGKTPVLSHVSFSVPPGSTLAIFGPTGCGKSTLVQLLSRLYDYTQGSVTIDGYELCSIDRKWIRSHIGFVLQEPFLFAKSIRENIALASHRAADAEVFEAARAASVHDVIERFERGYDTLIGERGVTLSGGQKQRLAIARALVSEPKILILDDSFSAVDTRTDARIRAELTKRLGKQTTILISHRVATVAQADLILVMEGGRIVERGTHQELVAVDGLYRRAWEGQGRFPQAPGPISGSPGSEGARNERV